MRDAAILILPLHIFPVQQCWKLLMRRQTHLLAAARSGHFDVLKHLISIGVTVSARTADGETVLISAARWRNLSAVTFLFDHGLLAPESVNDDQESLLSVTLQTLKDYELHTFEFRPMWVRVVNRLLSVYDRLAETLVSLQESIFQFSTIVFHLVRLKMACSARSVFARLVASQTIATRFRDFHTELTYLEQTVDPVALVSTQIDWESQFKVDELALLAHIRENININLPVETSLATEEDRKEAATLLQHKVHAEGDKCSPELLDLLELSLSRVRNASTEPLSLVPSWFISPHDIDADQGASVSADVIPMAVVRGEWSSSSVMVSKHRMPRDAFVEAVGAWPRLSHPNVSKLFGASHLQSPFMAVFENALSMSLRECMSREENEHLLWEKLYEVSLGLCRVPT